MKRTNQIIFIIFIIFLSAFIIQGCAFKIFNKNYSVSETDKQSKIISVTVENVFEIINSNKDYLLLDVRSIEEYEKFHIDEAKNIMLSEIINRLDELPKSRPIIVYCDTGDRSKLAANILVKNGFTEVYNMEGGILSWQGKGYSVSSMEKLSD